MTTTGFWRGNSTRGTAATLLYNPFRAGDILMVRHFAGMPSEGGGHTVTKSYELQVTDAGLGGAGEDRVDWIRYTNFAGDVSRVAPRDVMTRVDSVNDPDRKGIIKQTSVESGAPFLDVIYGMKTDPDNAVRARLGRLSGIIDYWWGQLRGYGLYSDNAYLRGDFILRSGEDVQTLFEIVDSMLRSAMQRVTYNLTEEDNFFTNGSFTGEMDYWEHRSDMSLYMIEDGFIDTGANLLSEKNDIAEVVEHDGRQMLRLKNSGVKQLNANIRKPEAGSVLYLGFRYICDESGTLRIGFDGTAKDGDLVPREVGIESSPEFRSFEISGLWDGEGDFVLEFTGDIYIEQLALSNRPLDDYKKEVSTLFEQTNEYIKAVASEINDLDGYVKNAGWITTADGNKLWATITRVDDLGNRLETHAASFHVTATAIEGIVTRIDKVEDDFSHLDSYVRSAGWITTADGNKLWATITNVDALGNRIAAHTSAFHVTAAKIESIVASLEQGAQWQSRMEQTASRIWKLQTPSRITPPR